MGFFSNLAKKIVNGISNAVKKVAGAVGWLFTDAHKRRALAEIKGFPVERSQSAPNLGSGSGESKIEKRSSSVPNRLAAFRSMSVNSVEAAQGLLAPGLLLCMIMIVQQDRLYPDLAVRQLSTLYQKHQKTWVITPADSFMFSANLGFLKRV